MSIIGAILGFAITMILALAVCWWIGKRVVIVARNLLTIFK